MKIVNLTPHPITVAGIEIPASGTVARCEQRREKVATIDVDGTPIAVNRTTFGDVAGLPETQAGVVYIVSALVAQAVQHRGDVLIVDDTVRDAQGRIIGARALATLAPDAAVATLSERHCHLCDGEGTLPGSYLTCDWCMGTGTLL